MGRLRIIAGEMKGRRIEVVDEPGLRPTADRVREALFSILGPRVAAARVLDAYAGTGALGFEALSRGARHVVFVEAAAPVVKGLERCRATLGCLDRTSVILGDPADLLDRGLLVGPFDLILADPPYGGHERARFLAAVSARSPLRSGGLLVLESDSRKSPPDGADSPEMAHVRRAEYGRTALDFYEPGLSG
jgi:16S rRNA (guanine(966)-N(2))-methyltransferase RsmD